MTTKDSYSVKPLSKCLCCNGTDLNLVLDLNDQPLANSYLNSAMDTEEVFPLRLNFCPNCTHLQLSHAVNPDYIFKHYLYVSGTSGTLLQYFESFVNFTKLYVNSPKNVLDIACNDGSQLDFYKTAGCETYGIDPAENLYPISSRRNKVICDYLTEENIKKFGVEFDIILAQNVFAHNDYPDKFLTYCKSVLSENGCIFVQTSQANMIANNEFDTIYHEHLSFFSVESFCNIARRCGLNVIDVQKTPIHGTSFVFVLSKSGEDRSQFFIDKEVRLTPEILVDYVKKSKQVLVDLIEALNEFKGQGYHLIGYGAAAKGNTLLNFGKIKLDYIVDDNELKQNLYTPGMHILIKSPDQLLLETFPAVIVPLAWNFYSEIKKKVEQRITAKFIRYFPSILVE